MKKFLHTCGMLAVILALAAGIVYLFWYSGKRTPGEMATLVKKEAKAWTSCI